MAKHRLSDKIDHNFLLWGITTGNSPHRLCWQLNQAFDWQLIRNRDIVEEKATREIMIQGSNFILPDKDTIHQYPLYSFDPEEMHFTVDVIHNKAESEVFMSELRQMDYLLIIKGSFVLLPAELRRQIQKLEGVQSVLPIEPQRLKEVIRLHQYNA
jgi:hypothetical protein